MGSSGRNEEIWARLVAGRSLAGLDVATVDGRSDLRGLENPSPMDSIPMDARGTRAREVPRPWEVRGVHWVGLDFSGVDLRSLRLFDCVLENCRFARSDCRDWRMWGTRVAGSSFERADLRHAALGGVDGRKRNAFHAVDFARADLRGTAHHSSDMVDCSFAHAKLAKVEFNGTVFERCVFEGTLSDVLFYRHAFRGEQFPPNEMRGVDLSRARLVFVEFRELDMTDVRWPTASDHVIIDDYRSSLDRMLQLLKGRSGEGAGQLEVVLESMRKWAGPSQRRGVVNRTHLVELTGEEALVDEVLAAAAQT